MSAPTSCASLTLLRAGLFSLPPKKINQEVASTATAAQCTFPVLIHFNKLYSFDYP